ncbi:amino acid ABC transporter ATP-binding protein [Bacillus sp. LL01]|uniref:ABC transporter ATP-binding protein n=1 Tax=Bacillus sp. LL01 TaxID=1665556 RepID=UPI00064D2B33|nr:phosphate ABC transporter ATP-binding protein [Bacillus sp. LL01]KMJ60489.1 amino acid ABC transporter ATP-binding protein [Bacillus sp. LL01]
MQEAIRLKNVHYETEDIHILKGITGVIREGEITTFVGPSGAGKTTLLKVLNGLLSPTSGEIVINGKEINQYEPTELRMLVGIALQSAPMVDGDVFDNLSLPLRLQNGSLSEEEAKEILNVVGLGEDHLHQNIKDLSGGQRQKVSIARTLVNRPKVLLLDEITASLDQVSQKEINELIQKVSKKYGTTIVWITHNLKQALTVGTYTWFLMNGQLLEAGKSNEIENSRNEKVQAFLRGDLG